MKKRTSQQTGRQYARWLCAWVECLKAGRLAELYPANPQFELDLENHHARKAYIWNSFRSSKQLVAVGRTDSKASGRRGRPAVSNNAGTGNTRTLFSG